MRLHPFPSLLLAASIPVGYKNNTAGYSLGNVNIQSGKEEKDLGIIINQTLKSCKSTVRSSSKHSK